ncbi:hypothetical protein VB774_16930 [Pseudanabaena galeata UHCC 0370]|uniref:Uncharacterized protein n=1 Tax=Pseudanabaena galeata UHCC 0370 TaxID=3110310 RepID=A0ABU5TP12_9CYAN|nr:hypothetical protein [Pseudanabaena galeata]MEA5479308.1 hypothetical protein [Pseudanabaena galeata UHCC 0370]
MNWRILQIIEPSYLFDLWNIAFISLVKYGFVSPPSAGKQTYVPRLLEKRYKSSDELPLITDVTWNLDVRPLAASEAGQARGHCHYLKI